MATPINRFKNEEMPSGTLLAFIDALTNRAGTAMSTRLKTRPAKQTAPQAARSTGANSDLFRQAVKLHQQGDVMAAEAMYQSLLRM
jgi:hypothetical protein